MNKIKIFSGNSNPPLAEEICRYLGVRLGRADVRRFEDGEVYVKLKENVRRAHVFIIQSTNPPAENILELCLMVDAARRASASEITAVIPYYGYACQDKKDEPRVPISAKLITDFYSISGINRIVTVDLHAQQIQGFFNGPVDHLYAGFLLVKYLKKLRLSNIVAVAPDVGRAKLTRAYAKMLRCPIVLSDKRKEGPDKVEKIYLIGDVKGKAAVVFDDMIRTARTTEKVVEALTQKGVSEIYLVATHPDFTPSAKERLAHPSIKKIIVTNTIPIPPEMILDKIKVVHIGNYIGEAIKRIRDGKSVSGMFPTAK